MLSYVSTRLPYATESVSARMLQISKLLTRVRVQP
jgi:hypothetical protein